MLQILPVYDKIKASERERMMKMSAPINSQKESLSIEAYKEQSNKMRKRILIILAVAVAAIILLFGAILLIEKLTAPKQPDLPEYEFYPTYQGNIMEYQPYLELDRQVYYSEHGVTQSITDENKQDFDASVLFLYDYIQCIITGDHVRYNQMFAPSYFEECQMQGAFSPQMLYNIVITLDSTLQDGKGGKLITYQLDYMFFQNDGTFRRDVDSNASRPQKITVRVADDGTVLIEKLITNYIS